MTKTEVQILIIFYPFFRYDAYGNTPGQLDSENLPPVPNRLSWDFDEPILKTIDAAYDDAQKVLSVSYFFFNFFIFKLCLSA